MCIATTISTDEYIPFLNLNTAQVPLPAEDAASSEAISIPHGFTFGDSLQDIVYVCVNGHTSLGKI